MMPNSATTPNFEQLVNDKIDEWKTQHRYLRYLPQKLRLERFAAHFRDERLSRWHALTEEEQSDALDKAFEHATELDLQRFHKISHWGGEGIIPMNMPEWAMLMIERSELVRTNG